MDKKSLGSRQSILFAAIPILIFLVSTSVYSAPFFFLLAPFLIVYLVEKQKAGSLGFIFDRKKTIAYVAITVLDSFFKCSSTA
jgi:hypothetical protein